MSGRRRRDDGWDEGGHDRQDTARDPWSDHDRWPGRGRPQGRERAALPPAGALPPPGGGYGYAAPGGGFHGPGGGFDAPGGQWSAGGDWPPATGYQGTNREADYGGTGEAGQSGRASWHDDQAFGAGAQGPLGAAAQGYGEAGRVAPSFGAGANSGAGQGFADQARQEPAYGSTGYASTGYASPGYAGTGSASPDYAGTGSGSTGYAGTDYAGTDYAGTGYASPDYSTGYGSPDYASPDYAGTDHAGPDHAGTHYAGTDYASSGYPGTGYAGSARDATQYGDQAGNGYGSVNPGQRSAGYGGADWSGGGYSNPGYGQPARSGSGFGDAAGYGPAANGRPSGSYPADAASPWRSGSEFEETPATAQYGRMPAPSGPQLTGAEYGPYGQAGPANGTPSGTPRPYGRLSIFTLLEDKAAEFDRLAERAAEGVRTAEPDTLVYVIHVVPKAPMQRIIYEIYRDREAFESHERQPHIQRFAADRKACVLATNIIDLRLKYAKVASLTASAASPAPPATLAPAAAPPASAQETRVAQAPQSMQPARATRAPRALEKGWPAEAAGAGYGRLPERDNRVPRTRSMDWDQPAYQGQRPGGN